jgi:hypothetical protein
MLVAAAAAGVTSLGPKVSTLAVLSAVAASIWATQPSVTLVRGSIDWYEANTDPADRWTHRIDLSEKYRLNEPAVAQSDGLVRFVRDSVREDDVLVYNISTYPTLLWNRDFSNDIYWVPGTTADEYPSSPYFLATPKPDEMTRWLREVRHLQPDWLVVYSRSAYVDAVPPAWGFEVAYQDPAADGNAAVTVLRRDGA